MRPYIQAIGNDGQGLSGRDEGVCGDLRGFVGGEWERNGNRRFFMREGGDLCRFFGG